jgi:hypothetical protein
MEFTNYEDLLLMDTVFNLQDKKLYQGIDFWARIRLKMSFDDEVDQRGWMQWKDRFEYLYSLGHEMKSFDEKYFDEFGEYCDDYEFTTQNEEDEYYEEDNIGHNNNH